MAVYTTEGPIFDIELERDADRIERKIVRVCYHFATRGDGVTRRASVRVSYRVGRDLLVFDEPVGVLGWDPAEDAKIKERAEKLRRRVESMVKDLGLELRGASYQ